MSFPCSGCGCCCKRINFAVAFEGYPEKEHPLHFPYIWDESGRCEMLDDDNKCKVYEKRPLICNIRAYAKYINADLEQFYKLNMTACNQLMDDDDVPLHYRINIE